MFENSSLGNEVPHSFVIVSESGLSRTDDAIGAVTLGVAATFSWG